MCGIGSITLDKTASPSLAKRLDNAATALLAALDARGGDACGLMSIRADGRIHVQKAPCDAATFNQGRTTLPTGTRAVAVHTRLATQGLACWNRNNHPVKANGALVIHNGIIWESFGTKRAPGEPEVDTYALALAAASIARDPSQNAQERAQAVALAVAAEEGSAAVQVAYQGEPLLISARLHDSPLHSTTLAGVRITASTRDAVKAAALALGLTIPSETYTYTLAKTKKNKHKKNLERTGTRETITYHAEGDVLTWHAGTHTACNVKLPEPAYQTSGNYSNHLPDGLVGTGWTRADEDDFQRRHNHTAHDQTYEHIARRMLRDDTYERCELCDVITNEPLTHWHGARACNECLIWFSDETATDDQKATT